jgi:hypothetical protein
LVQRTDDCVAVLENRANVLMFQVSQRDQLMRINIE